MTSSYPFLKLSQRSGISYQDVLKCAELLESNDWHTLREQLPHLTMDQISLVHNTMLDEQIRRFRS